MKKRIFISSFISLLVLSGSVLILTYARSYKSIQNNFTDRYNAINQFLETVLRELESNTDEIGMSSLRLIKEREQKGLLNSEELETLKHSLNLTDIYITDKNGHFIQTTDKLIDPMLLNKERGLFDFCTEYKKMITGESDFEKTPIVQSFPYRGPYKFFMTPNKGRTKILEVGIHLDSVSKTLLNMLNSDENFLSLGLYTPNGNQLEYIKKDGEFVRDVTKYIDPHYKKISYEKDRVIFSRQIPASITNCCECRTKQLTANMNSDFYYILRSEISNAPLIKETKNLNFIFLILLIVSVLISFFVSKILSKFLMNRLENLENDVQKIIQEKDLSRRVQVSGGDEITRLSRHMNQLLETLEANQQELIQAEKKQSLIKLAQQVAHDIKSPVSALNVLSQSLKDLEESKRLLFRNAIQRINDISNSLQSKGIEESYSLMDIHLPLAIDQVISEKRIEYKNNSTKINYKVDHYDLFVRVIPYEFKRVISNIINNSFEAIHHENGNIEVSIQVQNELALIKIHDNGSGIPAQSLANIFERGVSTKENGTGIGLFHAKEKVSSWGGKIEVHSEVNSGTTLTLYLKQTKTPDWFLKNLSISDLDNIVIFDDDDSIHSIWKDRMKQKNLVHYFKGQELQNDLSLYVSKKCIYLIDFEILNESESGLDFIEKNNLASNSVLVTSRYDDVRVIERVQKIGLKVLPKPLAAYIPIY